MLCGAIPIGGPRMAYFLKKSNTKRGVNLQIYESYRNKEKKETYHRAIKSIGYASELTSNDISDPIAYYQAEVRKMNEKGVDCGLVDNRIMMFCLLLILLSSFITPDLLKAFLPQRDGYGNRRREQSNRKNGQQRISNGF